MDVSGLGPLRPGPSGTFRGNMLLGAGRSAIQKKHAITHRQAYRAIAKIRECGVVSR